MSFCLGNLPLEVCADIADTWSRIDREGLSVVLEAPVRPRRRRPFIPNYWALPGWNTPEGRAAIVRLEAELLGAEQLEVTW